MERAIFISKIKNLKYVTEQYSRLYFGNEFCESLIPSLEDLTYILRFTTEKGMKFTLVSPYVTNEGIRKLKPLIDRLADRQPACEIVVNDWGILRLLNMKYAKLNLLLGRLLTKQKKGPRILNLLDKISQDSILYFQKSNVDNRVIHDFLISKNIKRLELDNPLHGILRPPSSINGSLYIPYGYVTTSRFCFHACYKNRTKLLATASYCNKECQKYTFKLQHKSMPVELILKGNTQFFKNEHLPDNLEQLNIDRLIYQPEVPL